MSKLRNEIVKLAYNKPHLRGVLLPLVAGEAPKPQLPKGRKTNERTDSYRKQIGDKKASKLYIDMHTLDQLVEMEAESLGMSDPRSAHATDAVKKAVGKYELELAKEILAWLKKNGPAGTDPEEMTAELMDSSPGAANAPFLVMMHLMGHGRGPLDGDWDHVLDSKAQRGLVKYLEQKLSNLVGESGSGPIAEALSDAAFETGGESSEED